MKIDNLYKIDKSEISHESDLSSAACFLVTLDKSHRIFTGHFPGTPVLPGVCTLQILKDCLFSLTGESLLFSDISQCKFTGMVDPCADEKLSVNISKKSKNPTPNTLTPDINPIDNDESIPVITITAPAV